MTEYREALRLMNMGRGIREVCRLTGIHRTYLRTLKRASERMQWDRQLPTEEELQELFARPEKAGRVHPLTPYSPEIKEWLEAEYSMTVIHRLLNDKSDLVASESTVRRFIHRNFPEKIKTVVRRHHNPGEIMEVDFGRLGKVYDPEEKRTRVVHVFSARLRYSRRAYRRVVYRQDGATFLQLHVEAFRHFGGVTEMVVPDNLKSAVLKAAFTDDPLINREYASLAEHGGFVINPTLPYTPEHKGGVESDIKYIKGNFLPLYLERVKNRGQSATLDDMQRSLDVWSAETADKRVLKATGMTPAAMFETEKEHLRPLPATEWERVRFKECVVRRDATIQYDKSWYTVPPVHRGHTVLVRATRDFVAIFRENREIRVHDRSRTPYQTVVKSEDLCESAVRYLSTSRENLVRRAGEIGPCTEKVVADLLKDRVQLRYRSCLGILSLAAKYGGANVEKAAGRAIRYSSATYKYMKTILERGLQDADERMHPELSAGAADFARLPGFWGEEAANET